MHYLPGTPTEMLAIILLLLYWFTRRQWLPPGALREWLERTGLTREQAVEKINDILKSNGDAISIRTFQRWLAGRAQPYPTHFAALQRAMYEVGYSYDPQKGYHDPIQREHWLRPGAHQERVYVYEYRQRPDGTRGELLEEYLVDRSTLDPDTRGL